MTTNLLATLFLGTLALAPLAAVSQNGAVTPEQRKEAGAAFQAGDWTKAIALYAAITRSEPANAPALHRLGFALYRNKDYERALSAFTSAADAGHRADSMYGAACMCALLKRSDAAFQWLDKAFAAGFSDESQMLSDDDLVSLRGDARFAAAKIKVHALAQPCSIDPKARQFDFWIGEWSVQDNASGGPAGSSSIQLILGDCVVFENWTDSKGGTGKSFNVYNKDKGFWQQTWVDDKGAVTEFVNGVFQDGAMKFETNSQKVPEGMRRRRLTFFDLGPDRVRQFGEVSLDDGKSWAPEYDLNYARKKAVAGSK